MFLNDLDDICHLDQTIQYRLTNLLLHCSFKICAEYGYKISMYIKQCHNVSKVIYIYRYCNACEENIP
jgi:hypothetical protein